MKTEIRQVGEALRVAITGFLVPVQTTREVVHPAFVAMYEQARLLVQVCKGTEEIPKSLLRELVGVYTILREEAPHLGEQRQALEDMADKIECCFRQILADEVPEDRRPGVPRIV